MKPSVAVVWAGSFNYNGMLTALQQGYATSSTDTGHKAPKRHSRPDIRKSWSTSLIALSMK
jgi:hypothetical protein